jgi:hypothetical protein
MAARTLLLKLERAGYVRLPARRRRQVASHVLGLIARRIRADLPAPRALARQAGWQAKYGHPVHALETFVDRSRFKGTCYRAANWRRVGQTQGRTRNDRKHRIQASIKEGLFKERLTALVTYMKAVDHASFSTIRKFVRDVMGEKVSRGYLRKVVEKASSALEATYAELLDRLPLEQALNVDETGHKDNGEKFWTWVFRAELKELKREAANMAKRFRENGKAYFEFILAAVRAHFRGEPAPSLLPALG